MSAQKGYSSQEKDERLSAQFQTIEPVRELQFGSTVVAHQFVFEVGTDAAEAGSTEAVIVATGHAALKGDVIRLTSGALSGREVKVWEVATNSITLAETLPSAVAAAVTFQILRHKYPTVDSAGAVNVNATIVEAAVAADGGALPALTKVVSGYDGTNVQVLRTDVNGELQVDVLSSALPSGAATEATLSTLATEATVSTLATEATVSTLATEGTLSTIAGDVSSMLASVILIESGTPDSLGQATMANSMPVVLASNQTAIPVTDNGSSLTVDGSVTANQGGTWNINNISGTISLPTGAATETTLNAVKTAVEIIDNAISGNEMQVDVVTSALPTGAATETTLLAIEADTTSLAGCVAGNEIQVDVVTSALPTGAATSAAQTNGTQKSQIVDGAGDVADVVALNVAIQATDKGLVTNTIIHGATTGGGGGYVDVKVTPSGAMVTETTLAGLDAAVLGQDTMANSLPVVIASNQTAIPVTDNGSSLTVDGTVAVSSISNALPAGTNTIGKVDVNTLSVIDLLDAGILDTSSTNIPGSASNPVQVVASTAAATKKLQLLDTTGAFVGVYTGAALSEVLQFVMGPGSDGTIEHSIPASTRISLKRLDSTTAVSSGIVAINFIG